MNVELENCKYCVTKLEDCSEEGLKCILCFKYVHLKCLKRGAVPGGLNGDVFFTFTCQECADTKSEIFVRDKLSWLQVIVLVLYHLNTKSSGLARKGFFHWRFHIATFIDKNWEILFTKYVKKKKSWTGTVAGTLSHFSIYFFLSGTTVFKEQAWWTLKYPRLSPNLISKLYNILTVEKQRSKAEKLNFSDIIMFNEILKTHVLDEDMLTPFAIVESEDSQEVEANSESIENMLPSPTMIKKLSKDKELTKEVSNKRKTLLPTIESKKMLKLSNSSDVLPDDMTANYLKQSEPSFQSFENIFKPKQSVPDRKEAVKILDPYCHYNTSLNNISRLKGQRMQVKLMGGIRKEMILSPYSAIYLKPYIIRDTESFPLWLKLMAQLQLKANKNDKNYVLPSRAPLDYTYVQPEHIPAINCLCNQFFWPGIDLTESLKYPDFSCVAQYKKLIIGFAFLVPDVSHTENYLSFIFTRPAWRNVGIAKFMLYHLIQTCLGKDITLHVSISNTALFLYQKFGFKVEHVVLDFYDKFIRDDIKESKHAFFCRLER